YPELPHHPWGFRIERKAEQWPIQKSWPRKSLAGTLVDDHRGYPRAHQSAPPKSRSLQGPQEVHPGDLRPVTPQEPARQRPQPRCQPEPPQPQVVRQRQPRLWPERSFGIRRQVQSQEPPSQKVRLQPFERRPCGGLRPCRKSAGQYYWSHVELQTVHAQRKAARSMWVRTLGSVWFATVPRSC